MAGLLEGDIALVTGSASGIGRAMALALASEGARVLCTDVDGQRGEAAAVALAQEGRDVRFIQANLATREGVSALLGRIASEDLALSLFVHSASPPRKEADTLLAVDDATWDAMLDVNLRAGFVLARDLGRGMAARRLRGRMLFITSLHAGTPRNLPHYSAAKAGQTMLVKELARALGPHGIRVNAIAPGAVPGGGFDAKAAGLERLAGCTALGRLGKPEEVAAMAVALLSERFSSYVTGTTVVVDGGIALHNWIEPPPG
jgi:NAD(P)-dependent dehydrogenase (short-subunit alcohol dehydrogenase family)